MRKLICSLSMGVSALSLSTAALAQEATADQKAAEDEVKIAGAVNKPSASEDDGKTIVVTGTSIRGAPPTGTNVVGIDSEGIKASGANTAAEVLANLPQAGGGFFNDLAQQPESEFGTGRGFRAPNMRALPGSTDTGSSTLVLLDGRRVAGVGLETNATDVNAMPVALLERVELNTDGGSSIYGSDSIGGVINFITKRRFNGVQVRGRYGFADDYHNYEVGGIVGHDIGPVNVFVAYTRTGNDFVFANQRDFFRPFSEITGQGIDTNCALPNVQIGNNFYAVSATGVISPTAGTVQAPVTAGGVQSPNLCANSLSGTFTPAQTRNQLLASIAVDFTDSVRFTVRGRYSDGEVKQIGAYYASDVGLTSANPLYRPVPGVAGTPNQTVRLNYAGIGPQPLTVQNSKQYGISPELAVDMFGDWQVRAFFNWDKSETRLTQDSLDTAAVTAAVAAGTFNPYTRTASSPAVLANFFNNITYRRSFNEILNGRVVADGSLFSLPAGNVRVAVGAEILKDRFGIAPNFNSEAGAPVPAPVYNEASRSVRSVFGEVNVPFFSDQNAIPGFRELRVAMSARYDSYTDFGNSFSPRIGATWSPFEGLRIRGNWGKSFRAPTVIDKLNAVAPSTPLIPAFLYPFIRFTPPASKPALPNDFVILLFGSTDPNLEPQTGTNWSIAAEVRPVEGLRAEVSYYNIDYRKFIGFIPFTTVDLPGVYADKVDLNPDIDALLPTLNPTSAQAIRDQIANGQRPYAVINALTTNMGNAKIEGIDYSVRWDFDTSFGRAYMSANGNYVITNNVQPTPLSAFVDQLPGRSRHRLSLTGGLSSGGFRTQLTLNHTGGYNIAPTAVIPQSKVGSYNVVNAFFAYEFGKDGESSGFLDGVEVTLNIQNLFNTDPPVYRSPRDNGYANGSTLGRLFQIGLRKDFSW